MPHIVAAVMPAPHVPVELRDFPEPGDVRDLTGGLGVDIAIEAAGSARAVEEALDVIRDVDAT